MINRSTSLRIIDTLHFMQMAFLVVFSPHLSWSHAHLQLSTLTSLYSVGDDDLMGLQWSITVNGLRHNVRWVQESGRGTNHTYVNNVTMVTQANQNRILGLM